MYTSYSVFSQPAGPGYHFTPTDEEVIFEPPRQRSPACDVGDCQGQYQSDNSLRKSSPPSKKSSSFGQSLLDDFAIGLLLALGQHSKSAAAACPLTRAPSAETSPSSPSPSKSAGSEACHYSQCFGQSRYSPSDVVNSPPSPTQEQVPASPAVPTGELLSDHLQGTSTDDPRCVNVIGTSYSPAQENVNTPPPALTSPSPTRDHVTTPSAPPDRQSSGLSSDNQQIFNAFRTLPSSAQEHIPTLPPASRCRTALPGSDHVHELFHDDWQCANVVSTLNSQEHVPMSQPSPSPPPDELHFTLSCWIKNMNKLSSLIDRLQKLASSSPAGHRSQLLRQVVALRAMSKKQQEHCMEFLQLSEEYAIKYLIDISAEIQQQSSFLGKLEERLDAAKRLRGEAANLQMFYESRTVTTMKDLRATALLRPLKEDDSLFNEVEEVIAEIRRCYTELDKFWTEEIFRVIEALEMRRVDPTDFKRWKNFQANLKQTIETWKNELPSGDPQTLLLNNACASKEADIGAIASSLSSSMGSLTSVVKRLLSSISLRYSQSGQSSVQRIYLASAANSDLCLSFLRRCADYGEEVISWRPSIAMSTSFRGMASHDLRKRTMRLRSEMTGVSVENLTRVKGLRKYEGAYSKALSLLVKTTTGSSILLEKLSSWVMVTDGHILPDGALPCVTTLEQHRELWEKARYSVRAALANLKGEPAPRLFYSPQASKRPRSVMERWFMKFVCFS